MVDMPIQPIDSSLVLAATSKTAEIKKKRNYKTLPVKTKADKVDEYSGALIMPIYQRVVARLLKSKMR